MDPLVFRIGLFVIAALSILGMLVRPFRSKEWMWAAGGALALIVTREISSADAGAAVLRGANVYAFLVGIMALAELARHEQLFDWLASGILRAGGGSRSRLLLLIYALGALVTTLLSNDTTAVVLTPAVFTALARTDADPLPYLYACAFVANAASFVLPISNPANLVIFGHALLPLVPWLRTFGLSAAAAVLVTYGLLSWAVRDSLKAPYHFEDGAVELDARGRAALVVVSFAALALVAAASLGWSLGLAALTSAVAATAVVSAHDRGAAAVVARRISWQIVPLVAGLFVIVAALDGGGLIALVRHLITVAPSFGFVGGRLIVAGSFMVADNVFNNLPVALAGGYALQSMHATAPVAGTMLAGVDIGPNLSVTGSLATLLWLMALRRAGIVVTPLQFFRLGVIVTLPALIAAALLVR
ncbi:MAG TPA: SLC13 family permease [Candidatus Baltobacteraceae bacterium]|nr:SLC13 family permease [Candidatus Baltobacteraceae bacterium]